MDHECDDTCEYCYCVCGGGLDLDVDPASGCERLVCGGCSNPVQRRGAVTVEIVAHASQRERWELAAQLEDRELGEVARMALDEWAWTVLVRNGGTAS